MTKSNLVHQEDDGTVTLFGGRDRQMLFACTGGHWWIVNADSMGSIDERDHAGRVLDADDRESLEVRLRSIESDFGEAPLRMMKLR